MEKVPYSIGGQLMMLPRGLVEGGLDAMQHMLHPSQLRAYFAAHAPITMEDAYVACKQDDFRDEPTTSELMAKVVVLRVQYADGMLAALVAPVAP